MEYLNIIISILTYFGITKETIVPPLLIAVIFFFLIRTTVNKALKDLSQLNLCIVEIQTFLRSKYKNISFEQIINVYGQANSPIVLKDQYLPFITKVGLDKQIENKKSELIIWLRKQKPKTGIDAQDFIYNLVTTNEIENYLDLTAYKQNLYKNGKTAIDVEAILGIYLFGILIPTLFPPSTKSK